DPLAATSASNQAVMLVNWLSPSRACGLDRHPLLGSAVAGHGVSGPDGRRRRGVQGSGPYPGARTIQEGHAMAGSMTEIPVNGDAAPAHILLPPSGSGPGVVVIQEWWGLVPHIRDVTDRLAAQGFVAVAPDLYRGKETTEPDEAGKLVMEMQLEQAAKDMAAAVDALLAMPETTGQGAGVGRFCVGGGLALFLASRKPEVTAVVCYYGFPRDGMRWDLSAVKAAVLGHAAEDDDFAPPELVERMERQLRGPGVDGPFPPYPGTEHAFFNDSRPEVHDAEASDVSWQRTLEFLRAHLGQTS